jgi:hypothetical protein
MLGLIERRSVTGYVLAEVPTAALGDHRYAAFKALEKDADLQRRLAEAVQPRRQRSDWEARLRRHIAVLRERIDQALQLGDGDRVAIQRRFLSLDVFQIHEEIRALLAELEIEEKGI